METFPTWIRLHPASVDETLAMSVQARIHDPLWLLGRQWQFGELRHDGGATPVDVRVEGTTAPLARMRGGGADVTTGRSSAITPTDTPLEALVEREVVHEDGLEQLRLRAEAGLHLLRMLRAASLPDARVAFWLNEGAFVLPADAVFDGEGREWWEMVEGRIPDGGRLPAAIRARLATGATPVIDPPEATVLRAWQSWAGDRFEQPASGPSTWSPEHMEYACSVAGLGASGEVLLTVPEYTEGRLEWYHFEQGSGTLGVTGQPTVRKAFRIPAPLDFAGMPNPRFWTFEDRSVQFDLIDVLSNPNVDPSPATLMVLDFALSYSDDWFLLPMALDAWSLFDATAVAITDVFGDVTVAGHPDGRWNLFRLDAGGTPAALSNLFVAAGPAESIDGPPLEEVHFLADEVANVAWGVERLVPHVTGHAVDASGPPALPAAPTPTGLVWTLAPPPPPGNWFPLLPTTIGRLALGALWSARTQRPAGQVLDELRASRQPLHQSEVPPEGAQVSRRWQSARAIDGTLHFWIGRSKTPRLSDTAPAVRFDVVEYRQAGAGAR
jgi:hypothetical protein